MSSVKISELSPIAAINANTANTLLMGVDIPTGVTGKFTAHVLAQGLYSNEVLNVGGNPVTLPNTVAQFALSGQSYVQTNFVNTSDGGSADHVITANTGTDSTYFIDMGYTNKDYQPGQEFNNIGTAVNRLDGYIYAQGSTSNTWGGNLIVGSTTTGKEVRFIAGGGSTDNVVARMNTTSIVLNRNLVFADGTTQNTAAGLTAGVYANAAFLQANTPPAIANSAALYANGAFLQANAAYTKANTAVQNTAIIQLQSLTLTGNLIANSSGQGIFVDSFTTNNAVFSRNVTVLNNLTANTLLGNIFFSNVVTTTTQSNSILWFPQSTIPTQQVGQLFYYSNTQSLILDTDIAGDRLSISKVIFFRGFNSTGATIPANSFVRFVAGVTTNNIPYLALADATSSANATVAGFVKNPIANGAYGFAYSQGIVEDLNSTGLGQNNDILFLSTTPGVASNVAPGGANTVVQLGRIILSDTVQGKIFVQNQLRQAYGRPNGQVLYAYANNIVGSNTISINDSIGVVNANTIVANTFVYGSATANSNVTQLTNKSTAVTSNGISGVITMNNAALAGQAYATFTVNNSYVQHVNDIIIVNVQNGVTSPNPYLVTVSKVAVGSFNITVYNADSGGGSSHSDAIVLNYAVMRVGS